MSLPRDGACLLATLCLFNPPPLPGHLEPDSEDHPRLLSGWVIGHDPSLPSSRNTPLCPCHGLVAGRVIFPNQ